MSGHDEPCSCGRPDPRTVAAAAYQRARARTQLLTSLADEGLTTTQLADVVTGVRPVAEVLAERDAAITPEQENNP